MKVKIRKAKEKDMDKVVELYVYSRKKAFSKFLLSSTINNTDIEQKKQYIKSLNAEILLAQDLKTKEIIGYIIFKKMYEYSGEIISFYLDIAYTEIYTKLFGHLKLYCIENNIKKIYIWTFKNNTGGIKFYKSIGFRESGLERESHTEIGQIEIQYTKKMIN